MATSDAARSFVKGGCINQEMAKADDIGSGSGSDRDDLKARR
jgi:hypothetical protein